MRRRTAVLLYLAAIGVFAAGLSIVEAEHGGWSKLTVVGVLLQALPLAILLGVVLVGFPALPRRKS